MYCVVGAVLGALSRTDSELRSRHQGVQGIADRTHAPLPTNAQLAVCRPSRHRIDSPQAHTGKHEPAHRQRMPPAHRHTWTTRQPNTELSLEPGDRERNANNPTTHPQPNAHPDPLPTPPHPSPPLPTTTKAQTGCSHVGELLHEPSRSTCRCMAISLGALHGGAENACSGRGTFMSA